MRKKKLMLPFLFSILFFFTASIFGQTVFEKSLPVFSRPQVEEKLRADIQALSGFGIRSTTHPEGLTKAAAYIEARLNSFGYDVERQTWMEGNVEVSNLIVRYSGNYHDPGYLILGGHYDSYSGPGADDNGTGVAALLLLAEMAAIQKPFANYMFVFFVNEEPPFFLTPKMGSLHFTESYTQELKSASAAIIIDMIGYYSNKPGSQAGQTALALGARTAADFLYAVGHPDSADYLRAFVSEFSLHAEVDLLWTDGKKTADLKWSDDLVLQQAGIPSFLLVDTGGYRYPHYHTPTDTPEKVDYKKVSDIILALYATIR